MLEYLTNGATYTWLDASQVSIVLAVQQKQADKRPNILVHQF